MESNAVTPKVIGSAKSAKIRHSAMYVNYNSKAPPVTCCLIKVEYRSTHNTANRIESWHAAKNYATRDASAPLPIHSESDQAVA